MRKFLVVLVMLALVTPVLADDMNPPSFRGEPLSYMAKWHAFTAGTFVTGIYADYENSVDDSDPATTLYNGFQTRLNFDYEPNPGWGIKPEGGGIHNTLTDASFTADVLNWVDHLPEKLLRVQVTYSFGFLGGSPPSISNVSGFGPISGDDPHVRYLNNHVNGTAPQGEYFYEDWTILPNPDWEQIVFYVPQGTVIEQIVIDTVSIPEPATMSLLALGGMAALRRRRK